MTIGEILKYSVEQLRKNNIDNYLYTYKLDLDNKISKNGEQYNYELTNNSDNYEEINGIKISKNRIIRNSQSLKFKDISEEEKQLIILTYGLNIDDIEFNDIKSGIYTSKNYIK